MSILSLYCKDKNNWRICGIGSANRKSANSKTIYNPQIVNPQAATSTEVSKSKKIYSANLRNLYADRQPMATHNRTLVPHLSLI
jgi:hypothetical protein